IAADWMADAAIPDRDAILLDRADRRLPGNPDDLKMLDDLVMPRDDDWAGWPQLPARAVGERRRFEPSNSRRYSEAEEGDRPTPKIPATKACRTIARMPPGQAHW